MAGLPFTSAHPLLHMPGFSQKFLSCNLKKTSSAIQLKFCYIIEQVTLLYQSRFESNCVKLPSQNIFEIFFLFIYMCTEWLSELEIRIHIINSHSCSIYSAQSDVQNNTSICVCFLQSANEENNGSVWDIWAYRNACGTILLVIITTPISKHTHDKHRNKEEIEGGNKEVNNFRKKTMHRDSM